MNDDIQQRKKELAAERAKIDRIERLAELRQQLDALSRAASMATCERIAEEAAFERGDVSPTFARVAKEKAQRLNETFQAVEQEYRQLMREQSSE